MITVIGKNSEYLKKITCTNCASILEYAPIDIDEGYTDEIGDEPKLVDYVTCPTCKYEIYI